MSSLSGSLSKESTRGSIIKYYLYKSTKAVEFYRPIMYLFFLAQGLNFTQIAILEAIYNLTTLLGEIPTGYLGDRVGRRNSLLIGTVLIAVTLLGIGLSESFLALAVLYVCWSAGYNFRSGVRMRGYTTRSQTTFRKTSLHTFGARRICSSWGWCWCSYCWRVSREYRSLVPMVRRSCSYWVRRRGTAHTRRT